MPRPIAATTNASSIGCLKRHAQRSGAKEVCLRSKCGACRTTFAQQMRLAEEKLQTQQHDFAEGVPAG